MNISDRIFKKIKLFQMIIDSFIKFKVFLSLPKGFHAPLAPMNT